jgi:DNA-directed RNA polymerase specialized sigma subunit
MKKLIDELYNSKYKDIYSYTSKAIKHFRRKYETELVISESYVYITERVKKVEKELTINEIEGMVKVYIKSNIRWDNSSLNQGVKKLNNINKALQLDDLDVNYLSRETLYNSDTIESMVNEYYELLPRIDKRLFHMYYYQDLTTIKSIKQHLNISSASAFDTYKDCKRIYEGLRTYIKKEINI